MSRAKKSNAGDRAAYTVAEVAERSGVSERLVWGHIAAGKLRALRLGLRCTRVLPEDEERWLRAHIS